MRIVRFVSGTDCQSTLLSAEAMNRLHALLTNANNKEVAKLCCKAGLCPLIFKLTK